MDSLIDDNTILAQYFFPGRSVGGCRAKWPMREMEMSDLLYPDMSPFGLTGADAAAPRWVAAAFWHSAAFLRIGMIANCRR